MAATRRGCVQPMRPKDVYLHTRAATKYGITQGMLDVAMLDCTWAFCRVHSASPS